MEKERQRDILKDVKVTIDHQDDGTVKLSMSHAGYAKGISFLCDKIEFITITAVKPGSEMGDAFSAALSKAAEAGPVDQADGAV